MIFTNERLREIAEDGFLAHGEGKSLAQALLFADSLAISRENRIAALEQTLELEREKSRRVMSENQQQAQRVAELEGEFAFIMGQNDEMEKELRAKDARIEKLEQEPTIKHMRSVEESLIIASDQVAAAEKRVAELEDAEQKLCAANVSLDARAELMERENAELKAKLATPVQLQNCDFESVAIMAHWCTDDQLRAWVKGVDYAKKKIREAGFKVEGEA